MVNNMTPEYIIGEAERIVRHAEKTQHRADARNIAGGIAGGLICLVLCWGAIIGLAELAVRMLS